MTTPHAGQYGPESFSDVHTGRLLRSTSAAFYEVGTTTPRTRYTDRLRTAEDSSPLTTDEDGNLVVFAEPGVADLVIAATRLTVVVPPDAADVVALLDGGGSGGDTGLHRYVAFALANVEDVPALAAHLRDEGAPDGLTVLLAAQSDMSQFGGYTFHPNDGDTPPSLEHTDQLSAFQFGDVVVGSQGIDGRNGVVLIVGPEGLVNVTPDRTVVPTYSGADPTSSTDDGGPLLTIRSDVMSSAVIVASSTAPRVAFANPGVGLSTTQLLVITTTVTGGAITWVGGDNMNHAPQPPADPGAVLYAVVVHGVAGDAAPSVDFSRLGAFAA